LKKLSYPAAEDVSDLADVEESYMLENAVANSSTLYAAELDALTQNIRLLNHVHPAPHAMHSPSYDARGYC